MEDCPARYRLNRRFLHLVNRTGARFRARERFTSCAPAWTTGSTGSARFPSSRAT